MTRVTLTAETIQATRQWFADNSAACASDALSGAVRVNDLPSYVEQCGRDAADSLSGRWDHTFTFQQRAHALQTGECVALLA